MIHLLHQASDPRFGTVDVVLDAKFDELKSANCSSPIFKSAKKAKHRIAVITRQFGGLLYISYAPEDEAKVAIAMITSLTAVFGQPLLVPATPFNGRDY